MFEACFTSDFDTDWYPLDYGTTVAEKDGLVCVECRERIQLGESYERFVGGYDYDGEGDEDDGSSYARVYEVTTCQTCYLIASSLFPGGHVIGEVWERIHGTYCGWDHANTAHESYCDPEDCAGCDGPDDGTTCCREVGCEFVCLCPERKA